MAAAVMAGIHPDFGSAQEAMGAGFERVYQPDPSRAGKYDELFRKYKVLGSFIERDTN